MQNLKTGISLTTLTTNNRKINPFELWFKLPRKIRFLIIGCFNALVSYGFYILFCLLLGTSKYQIALVLAWIFSSVISFTVQKKFVFQSKGNPFKEYAKCCISWSISYFINALFLEITVQFFKLNVFVGQIVSTLTAAVFTYVLFRNFAFKKTF